MEEKGTVQPQGSQAGQEVSDPDLFHASTSCTAGCCLIPAWTESEYLRDKRVVLPSSLWVEHDTLSCVTYEFR